MRFNLKYNNGTSHYIIHLWSFHNIMWLISCSRSRFLTALVSVSWSFYIGQMPLYCGFSLSRSYFLKGDSGGVNPGVDCWRGTVGWRREARKQDPKVTGISRNSPFTSCVLPLSQTESSCKTFHMKMSLFCIKMDVQVKQIFIRIVSHEDSFWHGGKPELGNGLLRYVF